MIRLLEEVTKSLITKNLLNFLFVNIASYAVLNFHYSS